VSHYVKYKSALDKNAYSRGTSVYFPDRVLPMLPKELSNGACSLNEGEDRFALSCEMTFDKNAKRLSYDVFKSVIKSRRRTTYNEIEALLNGEKEICEKYSDLLESVLNMKNLCLALEQRRNAAGSVNLDVKEAHIYVDEKGEITIPPCERMLSQRIIEQFMISANEAVAEFLQKNNAPCLYRVHESPAEDKAASFCAFLRDLGINVNEFKGDIKPADFQKILTAAEDKPYFSVINKVMLRTMQKARYAEENLGHFGLASSCYCHFTSPIRRYPDLFVHRSLKLVLDKNTEKSQKLFAGIAHDAGVDCSARERVADEAERRVDDLYKLAYMSERLGEEFEAVISGVTSHGIYCELENTVEGLVPLEDLPKDKYEFFEDKFLLKGARHAYKLGDGIKIKVVDCDLGRMKVLFAVI
ncbi:MAG: VacB/RNase II family 3'-5' exoribonuclease, partial [Clostridia bacterium]|nr:VacB/RNase II family 3'-5' exoribonuclease [Clostridia bacterium]